MAATHAVLNNGLKMPLLGFGTWKSQPGEVKNAVIEAIKVGYRHIDCAWAYKNQDEVGEAFKFCFDEGIVKREDLWITSKLWNDFHSAENVDIQIRDCLAQLKLDYLDLFLIHWPFDGVESETLHTPISETWAAMELAVSKGYTKTIGVSNFSIKKIKDMKSYAKIFPAVNQVELHPYFNQDNLIKECTNLGVHITAYSPLGSPDSEKFFSNEALEAVPLMQREEVVKVAEKNGKSPAQVLIRWGLQHGTSVLPKSIKKERIASNFDVTSWSLSEEDYGILSNIKPQIRMFSGKNHLRPKGPYRTTKEMFDE